MNISIREVNNGFIVFDEESHAPNMVRIGEGTYIATNVTELCEVIQKIYKNREDRKKPGLL